MAVILIIDDTPSDAKLMALAVQSAGYAVEFATTGPEGVAAAARGGVDLILLDIVMPGQDGFVTCQQLKADPHSADLPVILVSAKATEADRQRGRDLSCSSFLAKPYAPAELVRLINQSLSTKV